MDQKSGNTYQRFESIDIFRGVTIFAMIFVNDLASVSGMPQWLKHMPANVDGMSFVDVVFPAFLFIVGMAIPFAINKRLRNNETYFNIWKHILIRTFSLIVLGILMVNTSSLNESASGINRYLWLLLVVLGAILTWNLYPKTDDKKKKILFTSLRYSGILLLIFLALIFRGGSENNIVWLQTKWWGILGLIGWAYLSASAVYILLPRNFFVFSAALLFFILLYVFDQAGYLNFLFGNGILSIGEHIGVHGAITIAGMTISSLFLKESNVKTVGKRITYIVLFSTVLFAAGKILDPYFGISKIYATPTWGLYSAAYCGLLFAFFYWLIDVKKINKGAAFLKPAGRNPLLAYLLPDIFYCIIWLLGISIFPGFLSEGIPGILKSLLFAFAFVYLTLLLNKLHIKLHL